MEEKDRPFFNIHVHSNFSSRDCVNRIPELCKISSENNMGYSLNDHGSTAGHVEYYNECRKHKIKPALGAELYINNSRDRLFEINTLIKTTKDTTTKRALNYEKDEIQKANHVLLVAKNLMGWHNLTKLQNIGQENFYRFPLITRNDIFGLDAKDGDRGLVVTTGCINSEFNKYILNEEYDNATELIKLFKEEFDEDFYIELQAVSIPQVKRVNEKLREYAKRYKVKSVIANDAHYPTDDFARTHEILLLLQGEQKLEDIDKKVWRIKWETAKGELRKRKFDLGSEFKKGILADDIQLGDEIGGEIILEKEETSAVWTLDGTNLSFKTEQQLRDFVDEHMPELNDIIDDLITENKNVYEKIEDFEFDMGNKLPYVENDVEQLKKQVVAGLGDRIRSGEIPVEEKGKYIERIKEELEIIVGNGFASYFLILSDIMNKAREENVATGVGRGSACAFIICYLLNITRVNPILIWPNKNYGWRFLSSDRVPKFIVKTDDGEEREIKGNDRLKIIRDGKEMDIMGSELKNRDEIIG